MIIVTMILLLMNCSVSYAEKFDTGYLDAEYFTAFVSTILQAQTQEAINDYYEPYLSENPFVQPWFTKVINVERPFDYQFLIKLEVTPFLGAHNPVALDHLTFKADIDGVVLLKFEHLESYELPPHLNDLLIKPLP